MGDTALLAATLALTQQQQQGGAACSEAVAAAAGALLDSWVAAARAAVVQYGLLSEEALAALQAQWDWAPVLQQAAAAVMQQRGGCGGGMVEVRRLMQRQLRSLADALRRGSNGSPVGQVP